MHSKIVQFQAPLFIMKWISLSQPSEFLGVFCKKQFQDAFCFSFNGKETLAEKIRWASSCTIYCFRKDRKKVQMK